ncbi:hypothetical protein C8R46DRAFT_1228207 [Mycena filopes]|nr:hypothetical protein C8R46DRAFT_1228207 [Mycena filopes]
MVRFLAFLALSSLVAFAVAIPGDNSYGGKCDYEGEMKCAGEKEFATCDHGYFVLRKCAKGTVCRPHGDSILCDFPKHGY